MTRSHVIGILITTVIASLFYTCIWTCESNTLSQCFLFTGFVAIGHAILTPVAIYMVELTE